MYVVQMDQNWLIIGFALVFGFIFAGVTVCIFVGFIKLNKTENKLQQEKKTRKRRDSTTEYLKQFNQYAYAASKTK